MMINPHADESKQEIIAMVPQTAEKATDVYNKRSILLPPAPSESYLNKQKKEAVRNATVLTWPLWRRSLNTFVRFNPYFETFIFIIILCNCVTISISNFSTGKKYAEVINIIEDCFTCIFAVEMFVKMVAFGVFVRVGGYFHSKWNLFDFAIVVVTFVEFFWRRVFHDSLFFEMTSARFVRLFRLLRTVTILSSLRSIIKALYLSVTRLVDVIALAMVFTVVFGLLGMTFFEGELQHRCFREVVISQENYSSGNSSLSLLSFQPVEFSPICSTSANVKASSNISVDHVYVRRLDEMPSVSPYMGSYVCPYGSYCLYSPNPERGFISFNNILSTVVTLYSIVSLEEWSKVMYMLMGAKGFFVAVYFIIVVLVGTIFILNLALVIISDTFSLTVEEDMKLKKERREVRLEEMRQRKLERKSHAVGRIISGRMEVFEDTKPNSKMKNEKNEEDDAAIEDASALSIGGERGSPRKKNHSSGMAQCGGMVMSREQRLEVLIRNKGRCTSCFLTLRFAIRESITSRKWFNYLVCFLAFLNACVLASTHQGMSSELQSLIKVTSTVLTLVFAIEMILRLLGEEFLASFVKDPMNIFDSLVVIVSLIELFITKTSHFSLFFCIRLFRFLTVSPSLKRTLRMLMQSAKDAIGLVVLMLTMIFLFALIGIQLFSGKMCELDSISNIDLSSNSNTVSPFRVNTSATCLNVPRGNFDNILYSSISVFIIITGDGWRKMMTEGMAAAGEYACLYYCICFLIGGYLLLNLFIALLLSNSEDNTNADEDEENDDNVLELKEATSLQLQKNNQFASQNLSSGRDGGENGERNNNKRHENHDQETTHILADVKKKQREEQNNKNNMFGEDKSWTESSLFVPAHLIEVEMQALQPDLSGHVEEVWNEDGTGESHVIFVDRSKDDNNQNQKGVRTQRDEKKENGIVEEKGAAKKKVNADRQRPLLELPSQSLELSPAEEEESEGMSAIAGPPSSETLLEGTWDHLDLSHTLLDKNKARVKRKEMIDAQKNFISLHVGHFAESRYFNWVIVVTIAFSMVSLAFSSPYNYPDHPLELFVSYSDVACGVVFFLEAALKIISLGFWHNAQKTGGRKGYFQYPWNCFDFFLAWCATGSGVLLFIPSSLFPPRATVAEYLRLARALRPWSLIGRYRSLTLVFRSLLASLPALRNVSIIVVLVWTVYSIFGTQLFYGAFYACTEHQWGDRTYGPPSYQITERGACVNSSYHWTTPKQNFDHLGYSLITMFQVATTDNWFEIMYMGVDAVDHDHSPQANHNPWASLYFVTYIVIMSYFLINFFVSVMCDAYFKTKLKVEENIRHSLVGDDSLLSPEQLDFVTMYRRALMFVKPPLHIPMEKQSFRYKLRRVIRSPYFDNALLAIAAIHVLLEGTTFASAPPIFDETLFILDICFTAFFWMTSFAKLWVSGFQIYIDQQRNRMEVFLNLTTTAGIVAQLALGHPEVWSDLLRLTRIGRLFRILFLSVGMRILVDSLIASAQSFLCVAFILFLLFYAFAVIGVKFFGKVKYSRNDPAGLTQYANFQRFDLAMLTLVRVATVDDWAALMWNCAISSSGGECDVNIGECGWPIFSPMYFMTFILLGYWVGINFFTAVLMDSFSSTEKQERYAVQEKDVKHFRKVWKKFAGHSGAINLVKLQQFIAHLGPPLGPHFHTDSSFPSYKNILNFLQSLGGNIEVYHNHVTKQALFDALIRKYYGVPLPPKTEFSLQQLLARRFEEKQFELHSPLAASKGSAAVAVMKKGVPYHLEDVVCAAVIQKNWRGSRFRKVAEQLREAKMAEDAAVKEKEKLSTTKAKKSTTAAERKGSAPSSKKSIQKRSLEDAEGTQQQEGKESLKSVIKSKPIGKATLPPATTSITSDLRKKDTNKEADDDDDDEIGKIIGENGGHSSSSSVLKKENNSPLPNDDLI